MRISLVIITRNERVGVETLIPALPTDISDDVFCVDGGSTDGTPEFLSSRGIRVITQKGLGRGDAFRMARQESKGDAIIFFSPDGNEDMQDLHRFKGFLESGADLAIASRMMPGARNEEDDEFFRWRKWANKVFNACANLFWNRGPYVTDSINGLRAITTRAFDTLDLNGHGYTIEYQMTIRAMQKGLTIAEFPTLEGPRIAGVTRAKSIPTGIQFLQLLLSEVARSIRKTID